MTTHVEVDELEMFAINTGELYPQRRDIIKNLHKKMKRGIYDREKAVKLWSYWAMAAAKQYCKEYGIPPVRCLHIFTPSMRKTFAERMEKKEREQLLIDYPDLKRVGIKNIVRTLRHKKG